MEGKEGSFFSFFSFAFPFSLSLLSAMKLPIPSPPGEKLGHRRPSRNARHRRARGREEEEEEKRSQVRNWKEREEGEGGGECLFFFFSLSRAPRHIVHYTAYCVYTREYAHCTYSTVPFLLAQGGGGISRRCRADLSHAVLLCSRLDARVYSYIGVTPLFPGNLKRSLSAETWFGEN